MKERRERKREFGLERKEEIPYKKTAKGIQGLRLKHLATDLTFLNLLGRIHISARADGSREHPSIFNKIQPNARLVCKVEVRLECFLDLFWSPN